MIGPGMKTDPPFRLDAQSSVRLNPSLSPPWKKVQVPDVTGREFEKIVAQALATSTRTFPAVFPKVNEHRIGPLPTHVIVAPGGTLQAMVVSCDATSDRYTVCLRAEITKL